MSHYVRVSHLFCVLFFSRAHLLTLGFITTPAR